MAYGVIFIVHKEEKFIESMVLDGLDLTSTNDPFLF
jgi:hypothetical protein